MKKLQLWSKRSISASAIFTIAGLIASGTAVHAVSTSNLFFYINASDPGSYSVLAPAVWDDLSSSARNGNIVNSPLTFNPTSGALEFTANSNKLSNDASAKYVDMGSGFNNFGNGITIEFEGHFGASNQAWERIFDFGNGQESDNIWVGVFGDNANELAIELWDGNVSKGRCTTKNDDLLTNGVANNFAKYLITMDGSTCRIYKNGTELNTEVGNWNTGYIDNVSDLGSSYAFLPNNVTRTNNYIGKSNWGVDRAFDGAIKYVRIYTEALSASDVTNNAATYTLTYSTTGSDTGSAPSAKTGNGLITLDGNTGALTKAGHVFQGWATSANQSTAISGSYNLTANTTLYPAFLPNTYSVTYEENGGSTVSDGTFSHGGTLTFPANPSRAGYTFLGWFANATGGTALSASTVASGNTNVTLHAQWTAVTNNSVNTPVTSSTGSVTTSATLAKTGIETSTMVLISIILLGIGLGLTQFRRLENR